MALSHKNGVALSGVSALNGIAKASIAAINGQTIAAEGGGGAFDTTFDAYYDSSWALTTSQADRTYSLPSKPAKASSLGTESLLDHFSDARVYRATDYANDSLYLSPTRVRHEYSKRQAFNADNSLYLEQGSNGYWYLYDKSTFAKVAQTGGGGSIQGMAGDCEAIWHPTDASKIWYTDNNGGLIYYEYNVDTQTSSTLFTLSGKLPAGFETAARAWTKGEGRPSNDGRYWWLMIETDGFSHLGMVCYDRQADSVIGHFLSSQRPDHCSMSPLGTYGWCSYTSSPWATYYPRTFTGSINGGTTAYSSVEHEDLAIGADGTSEWVVYPDYSNTGYMIAKMLGGAGTSHQMVNLYPASGESTAVHISGLASELQPGWVLVSAYGSYSDYGSTEPAPTARWLYESCYWVRIGASPTPRIVSEMHSRRYGANSDLTYFAEPQATPSKDGTHILFASNWIGRSGTTEHVEPDDYLIGLPSWWSE